MTVIKNGLIFDAVHREPFYAEILIRDGKIVSIGSDFDDEDVIDAACRNIYPGFVEAHCHLGLDGYGVGVEGKDYNELGDICTPQMRAIDSFNPFDPSVAFAAKGGVTTVATGQGSSNAIGGTWIAVKTTGVSVDEMIIREPVAMKCALGENPKRCYREKGNSARMSTAAVIRNMLYVSMDYLARKEAAAGDPAKMPKFDYKCEAMIPVLKKQIPLKVHAHQANDILTAIRIAREFDVKMTLEHVTEGHLIPDQLEAAKEYMLAVGPTLTHATKIEVRNKTFETPGILAKRGCHVSIITDSPVIEQQYLPLCAGMAVKCGMDEFDALKAITLNAAEHIGVSDRVGSIEEGKDADIVIASGSCFDSSSVIETVLIDGRRI
ncbi:MAG: amidohydrolase [Erysipelotrichaceae bacterium]|nr:amidohydrolase [Erysipelotrichaceae bacterium]